MPPAPDLLIAVMADLGATQWTFLSFVSVFMAGSLIFVLATSSHMLIVGRAVAGLGTAGIQNGGLTITAASLPLERRPMATGIILGGELCI